MGTPRWCCAVLCVIFVCNLSRGFSKSSICNFPGCNCTIAPPNWKTVNCSFERDQNVELTSELIPTSVIEVFISGGANVVVSENTFTSLPGLVIIRIDGAKNVHFQTQSVRNSTAPSFNLQILNCEALIVEANAFKHFQSFIEAEISQISTATIHRKAFSHLLSAKFKDIRFLNLAEEAFLFDYVVQTEQRHGPIASISFENVEMPVIRRGVFYSALNTIEVRDSKIQDINPKAFMATQISAVVFSNTTIHRIQSDAFKEGILMPNFMITKCNISSIETRAMGGAVAVDNLTVELSRITEIQNGAINITAARVKITDNEVAHFQTHAFDLNDCNYINVDNNIIKYLENSFLEVRQPEQMIEFTFRGNEIHNVAAGALSFLPSLRPVLLFDDNFFNHTCNCNLSTWIGEIFESAAVVTVVMNSSFCVVNDFLSRCLELQVGVINMYNFTNLICNDRATLNCERYEGVIKVVDTTSKMLLDDEDKNNSNLILGLTFGALFIVAVSGTIVILLIRGGLWLKRKGYFRNMRYNQNEHSNDDENTIVTVDHSDDKLDMPEELTPELLQTLRDRLEDPQTHQEACEMIERLYDMFIVDESYTNNNRLEEEAHLYEELGNLQPQNQQAIKSENSNGPMSFLRLMEEKFNIPMIDQEVDENERPKLVGEYSEPSDAAVHLYSELRQNREEGDGRNNTIKSNASSTMALRPLPSKPRGLSEAGPSSQF